MEVGLAEGDETATVAGADITHPQRSLWPNAHGDDEPVTKLELAQYLARVAGWMLPHIEGRPLSVVRAPGGWPGETFFQRHAGKGVPDAVTRVEIPGDDEPYLQADSAAALVSLAQIACLEFHPWNCRPWEIERPGRLVFDLDPGPGSSFEIVVAAAREVKARLEACGLEAFCKTTGGKGLHVVSPLSDEDGADWATAKTFARTLCERMAADSPDAYLTSSARDEREGLIFLDYLRNDRFATAVAPLSPRARDGALVSMPLTWAQVRRGLDPKRFTLRSAWSLLEKSGAWSDYGSAERPLGKALLRLDRS